MRYLKLKRAYIGPVVSAGLNDIYTCPAGVVATVRHVNVQNSGDDTIVWALVLQKTGAGAFCDLAADTSLGRQCRAVMGDWTLTEGDRLQLNRASGTYVSVWATLQERPAP